MSTTAQQQQTEDDAFLLQVARDCLQQQLYASAEFHALRLLTAATSESGSQLTAEAAAILGESLFHRHEYRRAMRYYERSLADYKRLLNCAAQEGLDEPGLIQSSLMIRYRFAQCCLHLKEYAIGRQVLLGIVSDNRSVPMWMLLGRFHDECGEQPQALEAYRHAAKLQPMAVEAFQAIHRLEALNTSHIMQKEDAELMDHDTEQWIRALAAIRRFEYQDAAKVLVELCSKYPNNVRIWLELGRTNLLLGDSAAALLAFQKARSLDADIVQYMDLYASLLRSQSRIADLNKLSHELLRINEQRPEPWIALARYSESKGQLERALAFCDKAIAIDKRYPETFLARGNILIAMGQNRDALMSFKRAHKFEPSVYSFEGLLEGCLALQKSKEALHVAKEALRWMPTHPRALSSIGMVLQNTADYDKARRAFETALQKDANCIEAILALASLYVSQRNYSEAIKHLERYLTVHPTDWMYARLGDIYYLAKQYSEAMEHYNIALGMNSNYQHAKDGIQRVEKSLSGQPDEEEDEDEEGGPMDEMIMSESYEAGDATIF